VAASALLDGDHEGRTYQLSGPEALRPEQQVAVLADVLGRELRFEGWSDEQAREEMEQQMAPQYVDAFFEFFVDGLVDESQVLRPSRRFSAARRGRSGSGPSPTPRRSRSRHVGLRPMGEGHRNYFIALAGPTGSAWLRRPAEA